MNNIKTLILMSVSLGLSVPLYAQEGTYATRYGTFEIKRPAEYESETLYFNKKPVQPLIEGNNSLSVEGQFKLKQDDILIVQDNGGTACPAQLYIVKVSPNKTVTPSPLFGTCSDLIEIKQKDNKLVIHMPEFMSIHTEAHHHESDKIKQVTYIYDGKVILENGKILKPND